MSAANGEWNDIKCSDLRPFVCEIETRKFISTDQYIDALRPSYAIFNQLCVQFVGAYPSVDLPYTMNLSFGSMLRVSCL